MLTGVSDSAGLDAQLVLKHALGIDRAALIAHPERALTLEQVAHYRRLIERCAGGEPVPYVIGRWPFFDLELIVTPAVLIPRPETEHVIEAALAWVKKQDVPTKLHIADVGTGSGAIAVTLAKHLTQARVWAVDLSAAALGVAHQNAVRYDVETRIVLIEGDLLSLLVAQGQQVNLIAANLPYINQEDLKAIAHHEPRLALDGGPDGLDLIRRLLDQAPQVLAPNGLLLMEIGAGQGQRVCALAQKAFPGAQVRLITDYAGHDRVVHVEK
ncbi:MAG: peptide chain release factor N(5)-glutamine methyltransferase [Chloroflexi bacterium]|nr:peptide chain release factor N(5)-glutamine methyltransferase [Chloroflexota bacterium]